MKIQKNDKTLFISRVPKSSYNSLIKHGIRVGEPGNDRQYASVRREENKTK